MIDESIRSKIKNIKILTRRVMYSSLSGDYASAFKGTGLEFDQIREYQLGDDVRFIDWNSSAKMNKIMVKQYIEERDRTVILLIDLSLSQSVSSQSELKKEMVASVAASLAFIADNTKDKVGALFFSDRVEAWIAPGRGKGHLGKIIQSIFTLQPSGAQTSIAEALRFLIKLKKRNAIVFFLSDWIDHKTDYERLLRVVRHEYDFVGIRFVDPAERQLPDVGLLQVYDPESAQHFTINTSHSKRNSMKTVNHFLTERLLAQQKVFEKSKIDLLDLTIGKPFLMPMIMFFHQRIRRQI
jgi:uncharacterized protein (DUF58 family)